MAASEGALGELHEVIARTLKDRIQSGEASASCIIKNIGI